MATLEKKSFRKYFIIGISIIAAVLLYAIVSVVMDFYRNDTQYRVRGGVDEYVAETFGATRFADVKIDENFTSQIFDVNDSKIDGIFHISVSYSFSGELKEMVLEDEMNDYVDYTVNERDMEALFFPAEYMPWIKAAGYGWFNDDGNLYAQMFGSEAAEGKPNYCNKFSFIVRRDEIYYQVVCFCDTKDLKIVVGKAADLIYDNYFVE